MPEVTREMAQSIAAACYTKEFCYEWIKRCTANRSGLAGR